MIDWGRVRDLKSEIGAADFAEVIALFLEESEEVIGRISTGQGARQLELDLHFLKGAALNLGFSQLASLCQDGERRAAAGLTDVDLGAVRAAYAVSRQMLMSDPAIVGPDRRPLQSSSGPQLRPAVAVTRR